MVFLFFSYVYFTNDKKISFSFHTSVTPKIDFFGKLGNIVRHAVGRTFK